MSTPETPPPADDSGNPVPKVSDRAALEAALAGAAGLLAGRLLLGKGAGLAAGGAVIAARLIMDWQKSRRAHRETPSAGDGKTGKETKAETEAETETDKAAGPQAVPVPIPIPVPAAAAAPLPVSVPNPDVDANADAAPASESGPAAHSPIMESSVPEASAVTVETIPITTTTDSVESSPTGDSQQASGPVETESPVTESSLPEPAPPAGDAGSGVRNEDADGQVKAQEKENDGIPVAPEPAPAFPAPPVEFVIPETPQDIPGPFFEENPTVEDPVFPDVFQEIDGPAEEEWKPEPPSSSPAPVTAAPHTAPDEYQASPPLPPFPVTSLEPDSDSEPGQETLLSAPSRPVPQVADSFNGIGEFPLLPNPESFDGEPTAPDEKPGDDPEPVIGGFPILGGADDSTALESEAPPPLAPATSSVSPASSLPAFPEMATPTPSLESGDSIAPLPLSKAGGAEPGDSPEPETHGGPKVGPASDIAPFPETSSSVEEAALNSITSTTPAPASTPGREENRAKDYAAPAEFMEKPEDGKAEDEKNESDESVTAAKNLLTEPSGPESSSPVEDSPPESTNAPASVSGFDTPDPLSVFEDEPPEPAASVSGPLLSSTPAPAPISLTPAVAPVPGSETPETEKSTPEPPAPTPPISETPTRFIRPEDVEEFQARIESTPADQDGNGLDEDQSPSPPSSTLPLPPAAAPSVASARSQDTAVTGMLSPSRQPFVEAEQEEEPEIHVAQLTAVADAPASPRPRAEKPGPLPGPPVSHAPLRPLSLPGQPPAGDSPATAPAPTPKVKPPVRPASVPQATVRNSNSGSSSGPGPSPGMTAGEPERNRSLPAPKGEEKDTLIGGWITTLCSTPLGRFTIILIVAAMAALAVVVVKHLQNASAAQPSGAVMPTPARSGWPPAEYRALAYADGPGAPAWRAWP